jgi:hypothetical protein
VDDETVERIAAGTEGWTNVEIATAMLNAIEAAHRDGRTLSLTEFRTGSKRLAQPVGA